MKSINKIMLNSIYIYIGVIVTTIISLFSIPILLRNLGSNDYGLYNLVAGVMIMLSFVKSSMIVTVQRFLNVAFGADDIKRVNKIYTVSLLLYFAVALLIVLVIELLGPFISDGYLNIDGNRISAAILLFQVLVISTFFTTISVPFDALFNVYEDMLLLSVFNTVEVVLRFALAIVLGYIMLYDRLVIYAIGIALIGVAVFILKYVVCKMKYKQIKRVKLEKTDFLIVKALFSFIGWNLYSTFARLFSTQGFAIVLNLSVGTVVNAAYGIANQVNGCLNNFTSSIEKAFNPQIMKSEGMNDRGRMVQMSVLSTKLSVWIYSLFAIPLFISLPFVFKVWLKTPPEHTIAFTRIVLAASMVSTLSAGLSSVFYAIGYIKKYLLWSGSLLIAFVFVGYGLTKMGYSMDVVVGLFIVLEFVLMFLRLYYANKYVSLSFLDFWNQILGPYLKVAVPTILITVFISCNNWLTFILLCSLSVGVYLILLYFIGFNINERIRVNQIIQSLKYKLLKQ